MLTVEFDSTEYSVSEADVFVQLTIRASLPASFAYNVTVITADNSATGKTVFMLIIASVLLSFIQLVTNIMQNSR